MPDSGTASTAARIRFVVELARRLHEYGTSAQRLENAIEAVSGRLRLDCQAWSNPTGMILSFTEHGTDPASTPDVVKIIRLPPGNIDLARLSDSDAIAEAVLSGAMDLQQGWSALRALDRTSDSKQQIFTLLAFALAAACVAGLLRAGWHDVAAATLAGLLVGGLHLFTARHPRLAEGFEALAALLATVAASAIGAWLWPVSLQTVVLGALIVLLPGLMLTNAVTELAAQHWVSGSARFAGAFTVLLKLAFGTMVGGQLVEALGWHPLAGGAEGRPLLPWLEWPALLLSGLVFAVLFGAKPRDAPLVAASAWFGYLATRFGSVLLGSDMGVFFAGLLVSTASNIYARWANRPGALVRVPGIILLVPGSVGFRSLSLMFERDFTLGFQTAVTVLTVLVSLVAGLLFGNLLIPARRNL